MRLLLKSLGPGVITGAADGYPRPAFWTFRRAACIEMLIEMIQSAWTGIPATSFLLSGDNRDSLPASSASSESVFRPGLVRPALKGFWGAASAYLLLEE